jgi:hypothetical protein
MPTFDVGIGTDGVFLDIQVGLSATDIRSLRNAGRPVPPPRFTVRYQGLDQRLTGVEPAKVIQALLA